MDKATQHKGTPFRILLAGITVEVHPLFGYVQEMCRDYLTDTPAAFCITVTPADIEHERRQSAKEDALEGREHREFSDAYLESLAVYRQVAENMVGRGVILVHGSAVAVDGEAYLFAAKSGTGKSTHTRLWRQQFGHRAVMINDDKPLLKITEEGVWVCGTPWDGKHRLSTNQMVPLKAVCLLERCAENRIAPISFREAWMGLLQQSYRPVSPDGMKQTLELLDRLGSRVGLYRLGCNMDPEAAVVAYEGMQ